MGKKDVRLSVVKRRGLIANKMAWLFALPAAIGAMLFVYHPMIRGLLLSLQDFHFYTFKYAGLSNFGQLIRDGLTFTAWKNTLYYTVLALALGFVQPIVMSTLILETSLVWQRFFIIMFFLPGNLAPGIVGLTLWKYIYDPTYGLANALLKTLGLPPQMWLDDPKLAMLCFFLPNLIIWAPSLVYLAALQSIPDSLYEAAELDGAGISQKFIYVTLPCIRPTIVLMFLFATIGAVRVLTQPLVMTNGGPLNATLTIGLYIYKEAFERLNFDYAATHAVVLFLVLIALTLLQQKYIRVSSE